MIAAGKFIMTRDEILAVAVCAANYADDPHKAPASKLRRLLNCYFPKGHPKLRLGGDPERQNQHPPN